MVGIRKRRCGRLRAFCPHFLAQIDDRNFPNENHSQDLNWSPVIVAILVLVSSDHQSAEHAECNRVV